MYYLPMYDLPEILAKDLSIYSFTNRTTKEFYGLGKYVVTRDYDFDAFTLTVAFNDRHKLRQIYGVKTVSPTKVFVIDHRSLCKITEDQALVTENKFIELTALMLTDKVAAEEDILRLFTTYGYIADSTDYKYAVNAVRLSGLYHNYNFLNNPTFTTPSGGGCRFVLTSKPILRRVVTPRVVVGETSEAPELPHIEEWVNVDNHTKTSVIMMYQNDTELSVVVFDLKGRKMCKPEKSMVIGYHIDIHPNDIFMYPDVVDFINLVQNAYLTEQSIRGYTAWYSLYDIETGIEQLARDYIRATDTRHHAIDLFNENTIKFLAKRGMNPFGSGISLDLIDYNGNTPHMVWNTL